MSTHINRLRCAISNTPGTTGALTVSTADAGFRGFGASQDGQSFDCIMTDGTAWEVRTSCVYTHSGTSLSRGTLEDSSTGSAISLTSATKVAVTMTAEFGNLLDTISRNAGLVYVVNSGASQSLVNNAWNRLKGSSEGGLYDVETTDERGWWNVGIARFQPTLPGKYLFSFSAVTIFAGLGSGKMITATALYKNGASIGRGTRSEYIYTGTSGAGSSGSYTSMIVEMNGTTDYLEPWIYFGSVSVTSVATLPTTPGAHMLNVIYIGK